MREEGVSVQIESQFYLLIIITENCQKSKNDKASYRLSSTVKVEQA